MYRGTKELLLAAIIEYFKNNSTKISLDLIEKLMNAVFIERNEKLKEIVNIHE